MPKQVKARAPQNEREERAVRKLARSHHAPADWIWHARMVVESWAGKTPEQIAADLQCHPQTVRLHVARFNQQGIEGLGVQPGSGRKPRLTEADRSGIVALPSQPPPGRLVTQSPRIAQRAAKRKRASVKMCLLTNGRKQKPIQ